MLCYKIRTCTTLCDAERRQLLQNLAFVYPAVYQAPTYQLSVATAAPVLQKCLVGAALALKWLQQQLKALESGV